MPNRARRPKAPLAIRPAAPKKLPETTFPQEKRHGGLLVTKGFQDALDKCKERVTQIVDDCKKKGLKFRDNEFDLELDRDLCLHGLGTSDSDKLTPSDVQRVTKIFDNPKLFKDGADSSDIVQGELNTCWFLSALATMATIAKLVDSICVKHDQKVGVYGFIFFRDNAWVSVIIDDLLYMKIPKFEELSEEQKEIYHKNKEKFNESARKGSDSLYFSRSGTENETWVPLIEKAYAKLHGNYASLNLGQTGEAIEDLTGGVTRIIFTKDILDPDQFWEKELRHANDSKDRLFGCSFKPLSGLRSDEDDIRVNGLKGGHAYSVLRAVEYEDRRFLVIRNPWGNTEWTGPWSDGSVEWTSDWLSALPVLKHNFGNDGQFIMEYKDFLENWDQIDRTLLFDDTWVMSSHWLHVPTRPRPFVWSYGDVSFTISLSERADAVIVLSKLDDRYYDAIKFDQENWSFDFVVFKKGEPNKIVATSYPALPHSRSVNAEVSLDAGEYVVHVRLDYHAPKFIYIAESKGEKDSEQDSEEDSDKASKSKVQINPQSRPSVRMLTERLKSQSILSNIDPEHLQHLPIPLESLAGKDLAELADEAKKASATEEEDTENVAEAKEENHMEDSQGDIEEDAVDLGLRVYTNNKIAVKIDGQMRHASLARLARPQASGSAAESM